MTVVTADERRELGEELASALGTDHVGVQTQRFPDGERYARIEPQLDDRATVVGDLRPDESVVTTLLLVDAAREAGATTVSLAVPYLAYSRQDRAFEPGEAVSVRALLQALSSADALVTVDPHTPAALDHFDGTTVAATAMPEIARSLEDRGIEAVLAPDEGARDRARDVAQHLGCAHDHLVKERKSAREVEIHPHDADVAGRTIALVDDIIATGGTMATATRQLLDDGADRIVVAATHGIFADGALKRLEDAGAEEILVTDAIPSSVSRISVAPALARGTRRLPSR